MSIRVHLVFLELSSVVGEFGGFGAEEALFIVSDVVKVDWG